jgi:uncharacterized membrane protein YeaQ/YmgE (transglycosylase-associated protein family)
MTLLEFLLLLLIATTAGAVGELFGRCTPSGSFVFAALGFVGAYLGKWLASTLNLPEILRLVVGSLQFPLLWSIASSILLVFLFSLCLRLRTWHSSHHR